MRLWSIHPKYLDRQGLLAVWREGLLAQKVLLQGEYKKCACDNGNICVGMSLTERPVYEKCFTCKGTGKIKTPYYNHPQLERFNQQTIQQYLHYICDEGLRRNYKFDRSKILEKRRLNYKLSVTTGQLEYEFNHLLKKAYYRDKERHDILIRLFDLQFHRRNRGNIIKPHPLFKVVEGNIESWEKIK